MATLELIDDDFEVTRELLAACNLPLSTEEVERYAREHAALGDSDFRLFYGLRPARSENERLAYAHFHGRISTLEMEQRRLEYDDLPLDLEIVRAVESAVED
jgi:hypothetical protein